MRIQTGIEGFDELMQGGLLSERVYLVSGPQVVVKLHLVCNSLLTVLRLAM